MKNTSEKHNASVLALHGFTGCGNDFDVLRHFFPNTFFDCPDLHGNDANTNFRQLLEALSMRFKNLPATPQRILLGYSMGGRIALHLALKLSRENAFRESDRLVLISASPGLQTEAERAERRERDAILAKKILDAPDAGAFYAFWQNVPIIATQKNISEPWKSRILRNRGNAEKTAWANSLATLGTGTLPPLWDNLAEVACDTVFVYGENDSKFSQIAAAMNLRLPRSRLIGIPDCGHAPHLENPEAFREMLAGNEVFPR